MNASNQYQFVDSHFHADLFKDEQTVIDEINEHEILTLAVTNAPFLFEHTKELSSRCPFIVPALGLHPELAETHGDQIAQFHELLPQTRFVGEVGLDYVTKDAGYRRRQRDVFESVISACKQSGDKVLSVHSRRSAPDVLQVLGDDFLGTVIMHWYSGSLRDLNKAADIGCYFSVNVAMLRSASGRRIIQEIPADRLLTESDGPFAKVGSTPATPSSVVAATNQLAELLGLTPEDCQQRILTNCQRAISNIRA